ncbi:conserved hypothetical protein [Vibrio aestuarianus]|nr:hypothetical protein [Vibrio toranzoniae]NLS80274.1 hypothetical protein [Vibrio aestuarianus subsp. francensis]CAH8182152.1 conserved hypothetical protein [Vibrio aestuarianus]NAZ69380.1 hypothetical protein [Vibrio toranzoniae]CAH8185979.1 conserved hypothetical protein [Vibrio aestuarianus]
MKVVFVDAENVGLKVVEQVLPSLTDKVLVFSKSPNIEQYCDKVLFQHFSNYPTGSNQADFYIISALTKYLTLYDAKALSKAEFELYTNDQDLTSAFEFQCEQFGVKTHLVKTREAAKIVSLPVAVICSDSPEEKLFNALVKPRALDPTLQEELGLARQTFTRAVNTLSASNRIKRTTENKKQWVQC